MEFRKWVNKHTGAIHIVQRPRKWIALCGLKLGEQEVDLEKWRPTYIILGTCAHCLRKWRERKHDD